MSIIEISDLEFTYPKQVRPTLKIRKLSIEKGEHVFLFGPSGSGKSTLLELLAGVLTPVSGTVSILQQDLAALSAHRRDQFRADHIGYVFQSFNLIPFLNVRENIALGYWLSPLRQKRLNSTQLNMEIEKLMRSLGLEGLLDRQVTELSIGQQQRVAVARALLGNPEIILADEPTSSLDYQHREKFIKLLFDVSAAIGATILFVSHDLSLQKIFHRSVSLTEINEVAAGGTSDGKVTL